MIAAIDRPGDAAVYNVCTGLPTSVLRLADVIAWSDGGSATRAVSSRSPAAAVSLQPHRSKTFKLSADPLFVDKVRDIVGLYLDLPDRALVLCIDE